MHQELDGDRPIGSTGVYETKAIAADLDARRRRAVELLGKGWSADDLATGVWASRAAVYAWKKASCKQGVSGIRKVQRPAPCVEESGVRTFLNLWRRPRIAAAIASNGLRGKKCDRLLIGNNGHRLLTVSQALVRLPKVL